MAINRRYRDTLAQIITTTDAQEKQALIEQFGLAARSRVQPRRFAATRLTSGNAQYVAENEIRAVHTDFAALRADFEAFRTAVQDKLHDLSNHIASLERKQNQ